MTNTTESSATVALTERNFSEIVAATPLLLVDFWAPWCGPCRAVAPVLEEIAQAEAGRVVVAKVNVDEQPTLAQRYGVQAIPTLLLFKDGRIVDTLVGAPPKAELTRRLAAALA
jgi:thioredoxin